MSETLLGVIIGALAAIIGGIIGELIKYRLENKSRRKDKMQEAYEACEYAMFKMLALHKTSDCDELINLLEETTVKITLYASKDADNKFTEMLDYFNYGEVAEENKKTVNILNKELISIMKRDMCTKRVHRLNYSFSRAHSRKQ